MLTSCLGFGSEWFFLSLRPEVGRTGAIGCLHEIRERRVENPFFGPEVSSHMQSPNTDQFRRRNQEYYCVECNDVNLTVDSKFACASF